MARKKKPAEVRMINYGEYEKWQREELSLPDFKRLTDRIPAELDREFGYVLKISKGKGKRITFRIDHPGVKDEAGKARPPFTGEVAINKNEYLFYLGDSVFGPTVEDKIGPWRMVTYIDGEQVADKTLYVDPV